MKRRFRLWNFSLGFGLEQAGLLTLRHPAVMGAVLLALAAVAAFGMTRVTFDQDMRDIFSGDTDNYRTFVAATRDLADPENELLVLVEGPDLGTPAFFSRLQDFHFELQLADGVGSVFSLFSLRHPPPPGGGDPATIVSDPGAGLTPDLVAAIRAHPLLGEKLLAADRTAMLITVTPSVPRATLDTQRALGKEIDRIAGEVLGGTGVTVAVTGFPAIRVSIVDLLLRDQLVLNGVGLVIGLVISLILFRSGVASLMTAVPGAVSGMIVLGWIGAFGFEITVITNVIPALVMVIGYADTMHLNYAWRRYRDGGAPAAEAERLALLEVGPACILTAITTAVAFLSLTFSDIRLISEFGWLGAAATMAGAIIVLMVHAFVAILLGDRWRIDRSLTGSLFGWLAGPSAAIGRFSARHAWPISFGALVLVIVFGAAYLSLPPEHSVREHLPRDHPANAALGRIDQKLGGAFPVNIVLPLGDAAATAPATLARIAAVQAAVAAVPGVNAPLSLANLAAWVGGRDPDDVSRRVQAILDDMNAAAGARFVGTAGAIITVNIQEGPTGSTEALADQIEAAARSVDPAAIVTGAAVMTARESTRTIAALNWNLATDIVAALVVMMIAFRTPAIGWLGLLPNVLPLLATGALLYVQGRGLQFTTVVSLTIAYGIAVDDTVHYLNALLRGEHGGRTVEDRIEATARRVGPVIIGTTMVILAGLSTTATSSLPGAYLFGQLVMITLAVGVLGDLFVLPALIAGPGKRWFKAKQQAQPVGAEPLAAPSPSSPA